MAAASTAKVTRGWLVTLGAMRPVSSQARTNGAASASATSGLRAAATAPTRRPPGAHPETLR